MSSNWQYVGDQGVLQFFDRCKPRDRQRLLKAMSRLAVNPYVEPQSVRDDRIGRPVSIVLLNGFLISYWLDHFVNEVRVIDVEKFS